MSAADALVQQFDQHLAQRQALLKQLGPTAEQLLNRIDKLRRLGLAFPQAVAPQAEQQLLEQALQIYPSHTDRGLQAIGDLDGRIELLRREREGLQRELKSFWVMLLDLITGSKRKARIALLQQEVHATDAQKTRCFEELAKLGTCLEVTCRRYGELAAGHLNAELPAVMQLVQSDLPLAAGWGSPAWSKWTPATTAELSPWVRLGEYVESPKHAFSQLLPEGLIPLVAPGCKPYVTPAFLPFLGAGQTVVLQSDNATDSVAISLMQGLLLRILVLLPYQSMFTLLDPIGHGQAFPMRQSMKEQVRPRPKEGVDEVYSDLRDIVQDIRRVRDNVLGYAAGLHELDAEILGSEKFEFVFAANFPRGYDRRAIEQLFNVAVSGPPAGKYVFIHYNADHPLPRDIDLRQIPNLHLFSLTGDQPGPAGFTLRPDSAPPPQVQEELFAKIDKHRPQEHRLDWWQQVGLAEDKWWKEAAGEWINSPIGGKNGDLKVWFGSHDGNACSHGMLAGTTGSGKSTLYHTLILGLAIRYSPEQLRMYLVDGKDGVEFQQYRDLPHAAVVSLQSSSELSRSVLAELIEEKERRNSLFSRTNVRDLAGYYRAGQPEGPLPRVLLMVDEYQELFEDDREGIASAQMLQLAAQGRSAGIHMLLGSQRFGAPNLLNQSTVFNNIHLRMAMRMTQDAIQAISEFGSQGKQLIRACDQAGKIVVNDKTGDDAGNRYGKVAYLEAERQVQLVQQLAEKARQTGINGRLAPTVVFHGADQPRISENRTLQRFLRLKRRANPAELEQLAHRSDSLGGLGQPDWFAADKPIGMWLGQQFNVHGQALLFVRRAAGQHVALVGSDGNTRYGMLAGALASLAVLHRPEDVRINILDRSLDSAPGGGSIDLVCDRLLLRLGYEVELSKSPDDLGHILDQLSQTLEQRLASAAATDAPALVTVITEPDRIPLLRRPDVATRGGNPLYDKFARLLAEGAQVGIHFIIAAGSYRLLSQAVDERRELKQLNHRVALQMSEEDSFAFVRNRKAAQLQLAGPRPVGGIYLDVERGQGGLRFKPYSCDQLDAELQGLASRLAARDRGAPLPATAGARA